jgi:hypothetical protein
LHDRSRYIQRVVQESTQVANGAKLSGKTKPVVIAALFGDQRMIGVIKMKVTG